MVEEKVVDQASAARTISELETEIAMLARLELLVLQVSLDASFSRNGPPPILVSQVWIKCGTPAGPIRSAAALKGQKSEAQICREHNIAPDLLTHWKQSFLERAPQLFATKQQQLAEQERIAELEQLVGQLTLELAASKKSPGCCPFAPAATGNHSGAEGEFSGAPALSAPGSRSQFLLLLAAAKRGDRTASQY